MGEQRVRMKGNRGRHSNRDGRATSEMYKASGDIMPSPTPYTAIGINTSSTSSSSPPPPPPPVSIFKSSQNTTSALVTVIQNPSVNRSSSGSSPFSTNQNSPTSYPNHQQQNKCGKRYMTSRQLAKHKQTDKKAHKCPHCDKVYDLKNSYSRHVRTHSQEIQCPDCEKSFRCNWTLRRHRRTHTGEKPFTCSVCLRAFADKANLTAHIQTHSSDKPYICQRCGKCFILKRYLKNHDKSSCIRIHMQQQNFERDSTTVLDLAAAGAKRKTSRR